MNDDKLLFQLPLEVVSQVHGRHSRATVNKQKNGQIFIRPPDEQVLLIAVDVQRPQLSNRMPGEDRRCE